MSEFDSFIPKGLTEQCRNLMECRKLGERLPGGMSEQSTRFDEYLSVTLFLCDEVIDYRLSRTDRKFY
jgi:hypothetical protein